MTLTTGMLLIALCLLCESFFSGSEIALVSADRLRLRRLADQGVAGAKLALELLDREEELLGTVLIGTNLSTVTGSTLCAYLMLTQFDAGGWAATLVFAPMTMLLGEALPKTIYQHHADHLAPRLAIPLTVIRTLFRPFLLVVNAWGAVIGRVVGGGQGGLAPTREELLEFLEGDETQAGALDEDDRALIRGLLSLREVTVEECMTPLVQVVAVSETSTVGVAASTAIRTQHSRLPAYSRRIDNIVGVVHQVDLLFARDDTTPLRDILRPVRFAPFSQRADQLFGEMREHGEHFAVVVDEYGGCVGIVTLEDLLEEVVGDIEDERDVVRPTLLQLEDDSWSVPGDAEIDEIADETGLELPEGDYETIAGLVLTHLGRIPQQGERLYLDGVTIRVEQTTDRAVRRLRLLPEPAAEPADEG